LQCQFEAADLGKHHIEDYNIKFLLPKFEARPIAVRYTENRMSLFG
jgi:hypothetical protein